MATKPAQTQVCPETKSSFDVESIEDAIMQAWLTFDAKTGRELAHRGLAAIAAKAVASLPLLPTAQEWRDISTAPKAERCIGMRFLFGRWDEDRFDWIVSGFFDAYGAPWHDGKRLEAFELRPPTHFMKFDRWSMPRTPPSIEKSGGEK